MTAKEYLLMRGKQLKSDPNDIPEWVIKECANYAKLKCKEMTTLACENAQVVEVKKVEKYDYADSSNYGVDKASIYKMFDKIKFE